MSWDEALWWLPTALLVAVGALGFAAAAAAPARPGKKYWMIAMLLCGGAAIGASAWEQVRSHATAAVQLERLRIFGSRLDDLGRMLPAGPGKTPRETFDTVAAALRSLNAKVQELETRIDALQQKTRSRTVDRDTAAKIADYLRPFGSHRVVVSCAPDDVEAFGYANQIANVLRAAGWDALGPEKTTIFGEAAAMGVKLFVRSGTTPPPAAQILIDAFTRFNIPYQSGIAPSDAIPDPATVEIFVSHKP